MWWLIPLVITLASIGAALFWPMRDDIGATIFRAVFLLPALFVSMLAWFVGAICK
jgi:hypothetical protein